MARYDELPLYTHGCKLLDLALDVQAQLPRAFKRSLGDKIQALCVDMLEDMARANAARAAERVAEIDQLLKRLRILTALLRVGHDKKFISHILWARSVDLLDTVGSQAGGWRKHAATQTAPAA